MRSARTLIMAVVVLVLGLQAGPGRAATAKEGLARWAEGPVRYLLSRSQEKEFEKLENDRGRALFIVKFWQSWDPTPRTLENETRRSYWYRVRESNRRFAETVRPGWMTDRGRMFILLGEPDDIQKEESPGIGESGGSGAFSGGRSLALSDRGSEASFDREDSTARGLLRWIYRNLPGRTTSPQLVIAFTRDTSGEWRVSRNPENFSPAFGTIVASADDPTFGGFEGGTGNVAQPTVVNAPIDGTSLIEGAIDVLNLVDTSKGSLIALDLGEAVRVPSPSELAGDFVTAQEFLGRIPLVPRLAYFKAGDGNTQVRIGASLLARDVFKDVVPPGDAETFLMMYARFNVEGMDSDPIFATNERAPTRVLGRDLAKQDARMEAWTARTLDPGSYEMSLGIQDAATGAVTSHSRKIEVPKLNEQSPSMSSILPVYELQEDEANLIPRPRVISSFSRDEDFAIYFQVYNLAGDDGDHDFDLTYRFYMRNETGERPIGKPVVFEGLDNQVQGWSFPLEKWPPGSFRIEVLVKDSVDGGQARESLDFEVM